jgi:hypothetical protein
MKPPREKSFAEHAAEKPKGFFADFFHFIRHNKKWWITPIFVILILVSALLILGGSGVAPFIYSLF